jgi:hypothetical protein
VTGQAVIFIVMHITQQVDTMKYKVTEIKFIFKDLTDEQENDIITDTLNAEWEVSDPEELITEIINVTGYGVNTVDFHLLPD